MAEEKEQSLLEVQMEYAKVCSMAGEKQFRLKMLEEELAALNRHLYSLEEKAKKFKDAKR